MLIAEQRQEAWDKVWKQASEETWNNKETTGYGCVPAAYVRMANALGNKQYTLAEAHDIAENSGLYTGCSERILCPESGAKLINALVNDENIHISFTASFSGTDTETAAKLNALENSENNYLVSDGLDIPLHGAGSTNKQWGHGDKRQNGIQRIDIFQVFFTNDE